jgi:uncharacterized protein (DUF362 family)/NAD-dependent dihydropyrimidine dehydrogenase PreA subunit
MDKYSPVAITRCEKYDDREIEAVLRGQFTALRISPDFFAGKRVVIKPNLVMSMPPDRAATTHPAVVEAAIRIINEAGPASVTIAESPGGPYQPGLLKSNYFATEIAGAAKRAGAELNYDIGSAQLRAPDARVSKMFEVINPIAGAEVIVSISKLKTHALTQLSGAAKNYFGVIAGLEKVEMHARFREYDRFFKMIVDLCAAIHGICPTLNIIDGITGMEGNGPTGGPPKKYNCIISGLNAFNADLVAAAVLGLEDAVGITAEAQSRGLCADSVEKLTVYGPEPPSAFRPKNMVYADTKRKRLIMNLPAFLMPKPVMDRAICVGCGTCARSCPVKAIQIVNKKAHIAHNKCIHCYCCQELCHYQAVKIHKNILIKLAR